MTDAAVKKLKKRRKAQASARGEPEASNSSEGKCLPLFLLIVWKNHFI